MEARSGTVAAEPRVAKNAMMRSAKRIWYNRGVDGLVLERSAEANISGLNTVIYW